MQDEEFRQAISHHYAGVFRLCCRYFGNSDDASDAVQDIIMKVWTNRHRFRGESSPGTWIYRIATNVCLTTPEKKKRSVRLPDFEELSDSTPDDSEEGGRKRKQWMKPGCSSLRDSWSHLIQLTGCWSVSTSKRWIPVRLQLSLGLTGSNVRTRISRIKSQIKKEWEESNGIR
ncbi:MAG: RNA polymerase sigma factor [Marinilabiliales bacterium]|nr:RNA polymerase sigma factor [Marinilabiliales bacterium]